MSEKSGQRCYAVDIIAVDPGFILFYSKNQKSWYLSTLNKLNCFKDHKRYIHILNLILDLAWPK